VTVKKHAKESGCGRDELHPDHKALGGPMPILKMYNGSVLKRPDRLVYLDWMRGLAAAIMLQGHVFDGWVRPQDRHSEWFWASQFLGGMPAPIFLFLVGVSLALVLDRMRQKNASSSDMLLKVIRRGGWILLLAYVFRFEQFLVWYPYSGWADVFRIDTLNCIAASSLAIGMFSILFRARRVNMIATGVAAALVIWLTPFIYPTAPGVPSVAMSYLNGNGHSTNFSLIPWVSFALIGITFGYALLEARDRGSEARFFSAVAVGGICAYAAGTAMSLTTFFEYGYFNYSLTSPHFVLIRVGFLAMIVYGGYKWCSRASYNYDWSPLRLLGQASLLVYWIHIEIVYGKPFSQYARALTIPDAMSQLLWLVPSMLLLAWCRSYGFGRLVRTGFTVSRRALVPSED
jgi:uncharacterized membrane protein